MDIAARTPLLAASGIDETTLRQDGAFCVYGAPSPGLATVPAGARQISPLIPGASALEELAPASLDAAVVAAPAGTLERNYVLALILQALTPGARLTALGPKAKGGARLAARLRTFGCEVEETARRHHRICQSERPERLERIEATVAAGAPRFVEGLGWTQPGLFSWDRRDPGTRLLLEHLPPLQGEGADLGCGTGLLAQAVLRQAAVTGLTLVDLDRRAIEAARRNVDDRRASLCWADGRKPLGRTGLDFVVSNPPFHDAGLEDRELGQAFIRTAHGALRQGGSLWLVANRHLPYEEPLRSQFTDVTLQGERDGFKVYEARR